MPPGPLRAKPTFSASARSGAFGRPLRDQRPDPLLERAPIGRPGGERQHVDQLAREPQRLADGVARPPSSDRRPASAACGGRRPAGVSPSGGQLPGRRLHQPRDTLGVADLRQQRRKRRHQQRRRASRRPGSRAIAAGRRPATSNCPPRRLIAVKASSSSTPRRRWRARAVPREARAAPAPPLPVPATASRRSRAPPACRTPAARRAPPAPRPRPRGWRSPDARPPCGRRRRRCPPRGGCSSPRRAPPAPAATGGVPPASAQQIQRVGAHPDHQRRLEAGDVVEEPAAAGVHEQRRALQLQQAPRPLARRARRPAASAGRPNAASARSRTGTGSSTTAP